MRTPTIYQIKEIVKHNTHFFEPESMHFCNQTLGMFKVKQSPSGRIYLYSPICYDNKVVGFSFREFINEDLRSIIRLSGVILTEQIILDYIEEH